MKKLILIALILSSFTVQASCFKELCQDDIVRDIFGWKGSVASFDIDQEMVNVTLHHNGYTWAFPYKELGKLVWCYEGFCQGQELVDQYGDDIIIAEVYTHRMIYAFNLNIDGFVLYSFDDLKGN